MQSIIALTNDNKTFTDLFYYCTLYGYRFKRWRILRSTAAVFLL